jgi:hypothetical protein
MNNPVRWPDGALNIAYEFQETKKTADILANLDVRTRGQNGLGAWFNDLVRLVDQRLKRRCGVYLGNVSHQLQSSAEELLREYTELGWDVRTLSVPPSHDLVILDRKNLFSIDGYYRDATVLIGGYGVNERRQLMDHFESVWKDSSSAKTHDLIHEDLIRIIRGDSWQSFVQVSSEVWSQVFAHLIEKPKDIFSLPDRRFEELVAELLVREGFNVQITPKSRDGGYDILAMHEYLGLEHMYLVECKKYGPHNPVGVGIVRTLYGVVEEKRATAGIIATTSRFTSPAIEFCQPLKYKISLRDYNDVLEWIRAAEAKKYGGQAGD